MRTEYDMCRELVEFAGMTQDGIAKAIGYTQTGVSRVMSRPGRGVRYETGKKLEALYLAHLEKINEAKTAKLAQIKASLKAVL